MLREGGCCGVPGSVVAWCGRVFVGGSPGRGVGAREAEVRVAGWLAAVGGEGIVVVGPDDRQGVGGFGASVLLVGFDCRNCGNAEQFLFLA